MWLRHWTRCRIYGHWRNSKLNPQSVRVVLRLIAISGSLMSGMSLAALQRQAAAWEPPNGLSMEQQGEEGGSSDPTVTFNFNRRTHAHILGHGWEVWEVTIESERRLRERNRATQTLPFQPIERLRCYIVCRVLSASFIMNYKLRYLVR